MGFSLFFKRDFYLFEEFNCHNQRSLEKEKGVEEWK